MLTIKIFFKSTEKDFYEKIADCDHKRGKGRHWVTQVDCKGMIEQSVGPIYCDNNFLKSPV